jgi:hypothetical protein
MTEQPATYAAINVQDDSRTDADVESSSSGTYSAAASPYWVPVKKAGVVEPQGFSGPVAFCFTINYILGGAFLCWNTRYNNVTVVYFLFFYCGSLSNYLYHYFITG